MVIEIHLKDGQEFCVKNLKEIKAFFRSNPNSDVITLSPEDFCFSEHYQYHFVGDTTAIVSGNLISWVMFN